LNYANLLIFSGIVWSVSAILVILALVNSPMYVALAFRYFRRSYKFALPPGSSRGRFELTVPAFFLFFAGIGSAATLAIFLTLARPLVMLIPGGLAGLFFILIICGAISGAALIWFLRRWGIKYIDDHIVKHGSDKNQLMLQYLAPRGYGKNFL